MKRLGLLFLLLIMGGLSLILFRKSHRQLSKSTAPPPPSIEQVKSNPPTEALERKPAASPPLGDLFLQDYGSAALAYQADIELFHHFLNNVFLLVKQRDPRHYSSNEELAFFLLGQRGNLTPYLSEGTPVLNSVGQLVDRFQSPLIIHSISRDVLQVRSPGPDRIPYTGDDAVFPETDHLGTLPF